MLRFCCKCPYQGRWTWSWHKLNQPNLIFICPPWKLSFWFAWVSLTYLYLSYDHRAQPWDCTWTICFLRYWLLSYSSKKPEESWKPFAGFSWICCLERSKMIVCRVAHFLRQWFWLINTMNWYWHSFIFRFGTGIRLLIICKTAFTVRSIFRIRTGVSFGSCFKGVSIISVSAKVVAVLTFPWLLT